MTDQERVDRERDWVSARFNCSTENVFKTLIAVIKSDVASFNKLSGSDDCRENRVDDLNWTFSRFGRVASVSTNGRAIRSVLEYNGCTLFRIEIESRWNEDDMNCDLFIDGEKLSMHRVSQKIIGEVLFGDG